MSRAFQIIRGLLDELSTEEKVLLLELLSPVQKSIPFDNKRESTLRVIGALALRIRLEYGYISPQVNLIKELARGIGEVGLIEWLDENYKDLQRNGRIIRGWPGRYGRCDVPDLKALGLDLDIFGGRASECVNI